MSRELLKEVRKHKVSQLKTGFFGSGCWIILQTLYPEYRNTSVSQMNQTL